MLIEPLPALLSCVYRLTSTAQHSAAGAARGPGSLGGSENWMGLMDEDEDQQEQSTSATLKVGFGSGLKSDLSVIGLQFSWHWINTDKSRVKAQHSMCGWEQVRVKVWLHLTQQYTTAVICVCAAEHCASVHP